ncbi:sigma-70 family RNA polymerase sigma factor [Radiobacillus deserti]|uniref:Sigma-70 family RNA polymerase sigma factor n=1 Tax=Radiobacillus deserti TaxID=2594883 RepID=A0A516KHB9_9BACI|nr:sigma-70 family RNA polymerase sigma factor [Radiobacillus deserti]QDP40785.1 sigma-70 family RNA polymerase sigma factor [Radiobacillus deserti]
MLNITEGDNECYISKEERINELMDLYASDLKRIAYLYVNDRVQCEDIVQEVFISCYKNLNKFRMESSYKTWLIRITVNKCKDFKRKWSIRNIVYRPFVDPEKNKAEQGKTPSEYLEEKEDSEAIINVIRSLSPKYQDVLILFYYYDLTLKEISIITKVKFNTVKSRITRGRELLKGELERRGYKYG